MPNDKDFLNWIADRLVKVCGELEDTDYIQRLRKIAAVQASESSESDTPLTDLHNAFPLEPPCGGKTGSESAQGEADEAFMKLAEIFKDEAEYRDMILWTPMNPRKEVQGLTRNDIELIFSPARVSSPVRDFLQSLLAGRQPESAEGE